jgi:23S rRNA (cytosine1962-C5)-methyltransferase
MKQIRLKSGREKSVLQHRPWIFSGAVEHVEGDPAPGETVAVSGADGAPLGWAAYSPESQIRARMWSFDPTDTIDGAFLRGRLAAALEMRRQMIPAEETNALRLVHAESDGVPGLVVDRYADTLVMQCLSAGMEVWRETIADLLMEMTGAARLYERSDADVRRLEGLPERVGVVRGDALPDGRVQICENGVRFWVDVEKGHKTGFYLDQRRNRARVGALSAGRDVLNCFSYTGGFAVYALANGAAHVTSADTSADALALGRENAALNDLLEERAEWVEADVFHLLRKYRDQARSFDLIVLDPPKFAPTASQVEQAARGYKDINLLAFKLLRPGGILATFSCSGGVTPDLFQKIVSGAALDAGVDAQILEKLEQGPDHPVALNFPEGHYLKGLICRV